MVDVRVADDPITMIAALKKQVDDLTSTMAVRTMVGNTGDIEETFRTTPKAGQLFLQGQTVNRIDYPALWQWAQDQSLVYAGMFGSGDGSSTFVLPDARNKILRVIGAGGAVGEALGADTKTLAVANMPAHNHAVSAVHSAPHTHPFSTSDTPGDHYGHAPDAGPHLAAAGSDIGAAAWNMAGAHFGGHDHSGTTGTDGVYSHTITQSTIGSGTPVDVKQASMGVNLAIWT